MRVYQINQGYEIYEQISKADTDGDGTVTGAEVGDYNSDGVVGDASDLLDWRFSSYRNAYTTNVGYDIFGDETDDYNQNTHGSAPGNLLATAYIFKIKLNIGCCDKAGFSLEQWNPNNMGPDSDGDGKADDAGLSTINTVNNRIDRTVGKKLRLTLQFYQGLVLHFQYLIKQILELSMAPIGKSLPCLMFIFLTQGLLQT